MYHIKHMKTSQNNTQPMITASEAARRLGIGRSTFYDWLARGYMPHHRIGRLVRIHPQDLQDFIDGSRTTTEWINREDFEANEKSPESGRV